MGASGNLHGPETRQTLRPPSPPRRSSTSLRDHPEWTEQRRDAELDRLVSGFPSDRVRAVVRDRLDDLDGPDAEAILRWIEAHADPELLQALAEGLVRQPDLAPERAWGASSCSMAREFSRPSPTWPSTGTS